MPLHVLNRVDDANKHEYDVNVILYHKGKVYSAADDGKIKVWGPDLKFIQEVQAHPCSVFCITASDNTLYSCSNDGTVKSFDLNTLQEKQTLIKEEDTEFWRVQWSNNILYVGDDQGNVRVYKDEKFYASCSVAIPVKELLVKDNLILVAKDNDVIITDAHTHGEKAVFAIKATIVGRGPLISVDDKIIFMNRDGREIILSVLSEQQRTTELSKVPAAHEMIVNAAVGAKWDNVLLFTGGWDKVVKQWKVEGDALKPDGSLNVDFVVNAMAQGEKNHLYVGGGDGNLVHLEL